VVKDNQFNSMPLFIGAQGTLGIITKAKLQLVPIPKHTRLVIISVDSITDMPFILQTVVQYNPEGVETFDRNTFAKAEVHMMADAAIIKKYWNTGTSLIILAQFSEATVEETDAQAEKCITALEKKQIQTHFIEDSLIAQAAWRIRRSGFLLLRDYNSVGQKAVPCVEDIIVPIDQFAVFIPALVALMKKHDIHYGFHGHIGDGALRIIPIFDFSDDHVAQKIIAFTRDVFALVKKLEGNMSADHSDGIIRSPFLKEFYGDELYSVFVKMKQLFDPEGLLNSHKKIESSEKYIEKYLDR
jgi:FAD/FMN-containing dehydrogenase